MRYIKAPEYPDNYIFDYDNNLFLAGSILGASNWQEDIIKIKKVRKQDQKEYTLLDRYNIYNSRRDNFNSLELEIQRKQIEWEFYHLSEVCGKILFWFAEETLAPITLFEYGKVLGRATGDITNVFVGVHPNYARKDDVIIQTELEQPYIDIVFSLDDLVQQIIND